MKNESVPVDDVLPHLAYNEIDDAIAWLRDVFGFKERYRYGSPTAGAQMWANHSLIMLVRVKPGWATPRQIGSCTQRLTIFIDDVIAHYKHSVAHKVTIFEEPHRTTYGEFQYGAEDFDGHRWLFACHVANVSPGAWASSANSTR